VGEVIDIPRAKNETAPQLKRMKSQMVLPVAGRTRLLAALKIIATKNVKQVGDAQVGDGVRLAMFVDKQREVDSRFFLENTSIIAVAKADGREGSPFVEKRLLLFAQLRDVLTAKNSSVVAKKNEDHRLALP
jgi:hypothetical protein